METELQCPYCGEWITLWIDPGGSSEQDYIEDCQVCCRAIAISAQWTSQGEVSAWGKRLDD